MKKTIDLVKDSILCTIVVVLLILLSLGGLVSTPISSILVVCFLGCYFQNKKVIRPIMAAIVIFLVSFLIFNFVDVLVFILPSLILGVISTLFLKKELNKAIFISVLSVLFFIVNMIIEIGFAEIIMNMGLVEYITYDDMFGMTDLLVKFKELAVGIYIVLIAIISIMEVFILNNVNKIYKKRIKPLIGEKE